jgi:hypothetical protein
LHFLLHGLNSPPLERCKSKIDLTGVNVKKVATLDSVKYRSDVVAGVSRMQGAQTAAFERGEPI